MNDRGMIDEPTKCSNADCSEKFTMKVIHNRCHFFDKQVVKMQARGPCCALWQLSGQVPVQAGRHMGPARQGVHLGDSLVGWRRRAERAQENPNAIPEGETPHNVTMLCYDEMVDTAKPGDRVTVTGIFKATALRVNPRQKALKVRSDSSHCTPGVTAASQYMLGVLPEQADRHMRGHNKSPFPLLHSKTPL